jgi:hypothetical protein
MVDIVLVHGFFDQMAQAASGMAQQAQGVSQGMAQQAQGMGQKWAQQLTEGANNFQQGGHTFPTAG